MRGDNLVIVESPAKAKTIEKFLGDDFLVTSSFGHIRDLEKKNYGIDIEDNYTPKYIVPTDKKKVVTELKRLAKQAKTVWIASDEDREGEAIAWHLMEVLKLDIETTNRIVFHEITEEAIKDAIASPGRLDTNLVDAQQARRVLDRIVGFEISPVLWRKVKSSLSAGRVQSVAVRIIVERERERTNFKDRSSFKVTSNFDVSSDGSGTSQLNSELTKKFETKEEAVEFLKRCTGAQFSISDIVTRPGKKSPSAPFTTSTLQQEASRKLGFPVSMTMSVAQRLYENGHITYMRTDSTNLSNLALNSSKEVITEMYGPEYHKARTYKSKAKGAQEAHEAIRPTYLNKVDVSGTPEEKRLYSLIWKRTVASQMADAKLERTTVTTDISTTDEKFSALGEVLIFDGFLSLYMESSDDDDSDKDETKGLLPPLKAGQVVTPMGIFANERFAQKPARYTEASLVKKLEEQGIGRPSTYAPVITTIQNREYVIKDDRDGVQREFVSASLIDNSVEVVTKTENTGAERNKLFPTDIGIVVNDFLTKNFGTVIEYNFTADVEKEFDAIAEGNKKWSTVIDKFYRPFHSIVEDVTENAERENGERILGIDEKTGKRVSVRIGRYGPLAQLGEQEEEGEEKPRFSKLNREQSIETITLEEAIELFKLPRELGTYEDEIVKANTGRFGPYIQHKGAFVSIKNDDPITISLDTAIELIEEKREKDRKALLRVFEENPEVKIIEGRWGPYLSFEKKSYKLTKGVDVEALTFDECMKIIEESPKSKETKKRGAKKAAATKKSPAKKSPAKRATSATKKSPAKKAATKRTAAKKVADKGVAVKKTAPKKAAIKKE